MALIFEVARFRYAGSQRPAVHDVRVEIPAGAITALCGAAESGKSTLCALAGGFIPHFTHGLLEGAVSLGEFDSARMPHAEWLSRVGIVFQNPFTQLSGARLTVREEVAFGLENAGCPPNEMHARVAVVLEEVGLSGVAERSPYALSGGQQQLVAIASILVSDPAWMVLDEPLAQLDAAVSRRLMEVLRGRAARGVGVLIAEHNATLLAEFADTVLLLRGGTVDALGPPAEIFARDTRTSHGVHLPDAAALAADLGWNGRLPLTVAGPAWPPAGFQRAAPPALTTGPPAVEVTGLSFTYDSGQRALDGVSLTVPVGQRVALVGRNGAGKSTLARSLIGLLDPTRGSVRVGGEDVTGRAGHAARHIGYVFQNPDDQLFARRVWDEVAFGPRNLGVHGDALEAAVREALQAVGLEDVVDENPRDLDHPMRKRLALASVLAMRAPVLVLDEPTGGLDAHEHRRLARLVETLPGTAILISHDMTFCADHCERMIVLHEGRVAADGTPDEVLGDDEVCVKCGLAQPAAVALSRECGITPPVARRAGLTR